MGTTEYMAVLPEAAEYKNQTAAYKECQKYNMNLITIERQAEQKEIMEKLKQYEREPAVYWISLDRKDKKSGWRWKYPVTVGEESKDKLCLLNKNTPTFWHRNTAPTEYDDLNCVHMRINYAEDQTDDVVEHYNWKGDLCDLNADGDLGSAHGFICAAQSEMEACKTTDAVATITLSLGLLISMTLMQ